MLSGSKVWPLVTIATVVAVGCSDASSTQPVVAPYPEPVETREWSNPYAVVLDQYVQVLYGHVEVPLVDLIVCSGTDELQSDVRRFQESGATVALLLDTVGRPADDDVAFGVAVASAVGDVANTQQRVELSATATFRERAGGPRSLCLSSLRVDGAADALPGVDVSALDFGQT